MVRNTPQARGDGGMLDREQLYRENWGHDIVLESVRHTFTLRW